MLDTLGHIAAPRRLSMKTQAFGKPLFIDGVLPAWSCILVFQ